ncbi:hypothetical protein Tco_1262315 [Tanacetum coccineum]
MNVGLRWCRLVWVTTVSDDGDDWIWSGEGDDERWRHGVGFGWDPGGSFDGRRRLERAEGWPDPRRRQKQRRVRDVARGTIVTLEPFKTDSGGLSGSSSYSCHIGDH